MASRLSREDLKSTYETGLQGLSREAPNFSRSTDSMLYPQDLDSLLKNENAEELVQNLSPQALYLALKLKGERDCLEVLSLVSNDQFTRLYDYDVWRGEELEVKKAAHWLDLLHEASPKLMYERFRGLEEEYQIALLSPLVRVFDMEAYDSMPDEDQDKLYRLPGDAFFYSLLSDDPELHRTIENLIQASLAEDINYTMSLLAHAAYHPPHEDEFTLLQFRRARLEEDGFVSYEDGLLYFTPLTKDQMEYKRNQYLFSQAPKSQLVEEGTSQLFLDHLLELSPQLLEQQKLPLLGLANALCSVTYIEAGDIQGLKNVLYHAKAVVSLSLEYLSGKDLRIASRILVEESMKVLFQVGITLFAELREELIQKLSEMPSLSILKLREYTILGKYGLALEWCDQHLLAYLGFEQNETIKGILNRFPLYPYSTQDRERISFEPLHSLKELALLRNFLNGLSWKETFQLKNTHEAPKTDIIM